MTQDTLTGRTVGGYQLMRRLGRGGMASVYLAHDLKLQREVALKVLHGIDAADPSFRARFEQEALATARLDHPNIIHIYDYGHEGDLTFMAMEYCPNGTLLDVIVRASQQGTPIDPDYATTVIGQVAIALDFAHQHGIIHRDIKPSNILFAKDGRPVLADLGIAKALAGPKLTRTQTTVGTPEYMSPEQGRGETIDQRSDLYSLGVVLYEMLAGRPPFQADTPWGVIYKHMSEPPLPIRQVNPRVSVALASVLERAMTKKPTDRFQSGREMAEALRMAQQRPNQPVTVQPVRRTPAPARAAAAESPTVLATPSTPYPLPAATATSSVRPGWAPLRWLLPLVAVLAALAIVLAVVALPRLAPPTATPIVENTLEPPLPTEAGDDTAATPVPTDTPMVPIVEREVMVTSKGTALPPPPPAPEATVVYLWQPVVSVDEDFAQPSAAWPSIEDDSSSWLLADGTYRLAVKNPNSMVWVVRGVDVGDFSLAVDIQPAVDDPGVHAGFLFRVSGANSFYRLDYSPGRGVELSKRVDGKDTVLIQRAADALPRNSGAIRLGVDASGSVIQAFANGRLVGKISDGDLARGDLALYGVSGGSTPAEITFDNLNLEPKATEAIPVVLVPYHDPDGRFTLHVPQDWKPGADALGINFESPNRMARVLVFEAVGIAADDAPVAVARQALAQAQAIYPDFAVGQGGERLLAGLPAYEQVLTGQVLGVDVVARLIAFNQSGTGYAVVTVSQAEADAALRPLLAYIVDTFRPAKPPAPTPTDTPADLPALETPASAPTPTAKPIPSTSESAMAPPQLPKPAVILDFETFGTWERGDEPHGTLTQANDRKHDGNSAAKLTYNMPAVPNNYVVFLRQPPLKIPGKPEALNLWVYGDGSGHFLNAWIKDAQGEVRQFTFGKVLHADTWQQMTVTLDTTADWPQGHISGADNGQFDYPIQLHALVLDAVADGVASKGVLYLDDLATGAGVATPMSAQPADTPATTPAEPVPPAAPAALSGHILFASDGDVIALDVASRNTWPVFRNGRQPDIRADGRVVVNGTGGGKDNLFTVNLDGGSEIMNGLHPEDSYPHWSPSGQSAVFHSTLQGDGRERIYIQWDMTHSEEPALLKIGNYDVLGRDPTWMQNWRIAFTGCDYWASGSTCGLWAIDSNGKGNPVKLTDRTDDRGTDSSSSTLLFSSQVTGNWDVWAVSVNGGEVRNLTNSPSQDVGATFSPDGSSIAFMSDRDGGWGIWVMNADGGNPRKLLAVPNGFGRDWPGERLAWGP